ncbi:MAG: PspC domain-containing protein [Candidatus Brocadiaceae bacterium]|nr:PspC domain-containing protein [Candidatus Brocadiaceae bacterium]
MNVNDWQRRTGPYRARDGLILGVCKGMARYMQCSVLVVRLIVIILTLLSTVWPMLLVYFLAGVLMKPEPVVPLETAGDAEFYSSFAGSRRMAVDRLKASFDRLDRRIRRMEGIVTDREYDWERRIRR